MKDGADYDLQLEQFWLSSTNVVLMSRLTVFF